MPNWPSPTDRRDVVAEAERILLENEDLRESFAELQLALEDKGWLALSVNAAQEFTRDGLARAAGLCRILAVSNPLIKRGLALRHAYVWGSGVEISAADPDVQAVVAEFNTGAERSLTGSQAREELERALGTDGNVFLALFTNPLTGVVQPRSIPFEEIAEVVCNPDDRDEPWFYLRRWTSFEIDQMGRRQTIRSEAYYPAVGYRPRSRWRMLDDVEVLWDAPMVHVSVNRLDGWDFGVGDAYAAMTWARAYKEFLADWARLAKSLSRFAWRISGERKSGAHKAAQEVRANLTAPHDPTGAGAAFASSGSTLEAIPKSGATIDADSGKPLAGMVAAALGVPVTMLLADPGQTGARAVAETLDEPTRLEMQNRRALWASTLRQIYDYVIDQAVKAPRGPLSGTVVWDGDHEVRTRGGGLMSDFGELDALIADMTAVPRELDGLVRTVVQKAAADIKADAQLLAPVDTGNLRSSITYETQIGADAVTGEIGPAADYGIYVELGTEKMAPQPYLGPAFDRHSDAFEGALGQILGGLL